MASNIVPTETSNQFVDISTSKNRRQCRVKRQHKSAEKSEVPSYMVNDAPITYDEKTMNYYKTIRQCHIDPILNTEVDESIAFKFKYQWDPYTGDRLGVDPFGPLYFDPASLVYHFYLHRLDGLWKSDVDTKDGYFQGYYDMLVGTGEDLEVVGRDKYTELYLFRLPILDCYLTKDHNNSFVTVGPKLTTDEILELEKLCNVRSVREIYASNFNHQCPSIKLMKKLYDSSIAKEITLPENIQRKYITPQHYYVDALRMM